MPQNKRSSRLRLATLALLAAAVSGLSAVIYAADPGGDLEKQRPKWKIDKIPDAPPLSPEEAIKSFKLPPGFKIELVAAEPMVEVPIAMAFDPDGRAYVCELRAYMPDIAGTDELKPIGRISRLEDTDNDGVFDKSVIFMDNLSIPRAIGFMGDGVLVSEPPNLYLAKDTDGDGKADTKTTIATDYASKNANPEHMANGLVWMLDNWCYSANWAARFRMAGGKLVREGTISRGQWGITQDDEGRLFYNSNSSMLRADLMPAQFLTRNPFVASPVGVNFGVAPNKVYPGRVNPGVNRGYTNVLDLDGKLQSVTAACGPQIYRGDAFPEEYRGNAFVLEPSGNLIIRHTLEKKGVSVVGTSVQHDGTSLGNEKIQKIDFLVSTDERFRPVSMYNGPDGALYVVDMYHGILQHKAYLSAYLQDQIKQRDLDKNNNTRGRIWRIVPENFKQPAKGPKLSTATSAELAKTLSHPNGWWRDTAQRLLVERNDPKIVSTLQKIVAGKEADVTGLGRIHALWTLAGMDRLEDEVAAAAMKDADPKIRLQALRAAEPLIRKLAGIETLSALPEMANDSDLEVQLQVLAYSTPANADLQPAATKILAKNLSNPVFRSAALSAAAGRELELLQILLADKGFAEAAAKDKQSLYNDLAECVVRGRSAPRIDQLFTMIATIPDDQKSDQKAMIQGVADAVIPDPKSKTPPRRKLRLAQEPAGLTTLLKSSDKKVAELATTIEAGLSWPNKPGDKTPPLKPLTQEQEQRFAAGKELYTSLCGVCHQPSGMGMEGVAPALLDSEWVLGSAERPARIVLHGVTGPIKVGKKTFDSEMPGLKVLDDEQIAAILTYIRREWGHEADPVEPATIAKIRKATADRGEQQWTAEELMQVK